jgi:hypothetical protein
VIAITKCRVLLGPAAVHAWASGHSPPALWKGQCAKVLARRDVGGPAFAGMTSLAGEPLNGRSGFTIAADCPLLAERAWGMSVGRSLGSVASYDCAHVRRRAEGGKQGSDGAKVVMGPCVVFKDDAGPPRWGAYGGRYDPAGPPRLRRKGPIEYPEMS